MPTRKRRADGTLRPAYARYSRRKKMRQILAFENDPANTEWLAQFNPGERMRFLTNVLHYKVIWLRAFMETTGLDELEASRALERMGHERRWMKLRKADGMVVGIGPPRRRQKRKQKDPTDRIDDLVVSKNHEGPT